MLAAEFHRKRLEPRAFQVREYQSTAHVGSSSKLLVETSRGGSISGALPLDRNNRSCTVRGTVSVTIVPDAWYLVLPEYSCNYSSVPTGVSIVELLCCLFVHQSVR